MHHVEPAGPQHLAQGSAAGAVHERPVRAAGRGAPGPGEHVHLVAGPTLVGRETADVRLDAAEVREVDVSDVDDAHQEAAGATGVDDPRWASHQPSSQAPPTGISRPKTKAR